MRIIIGIIAVILVGGLIVFLPLGFIFALNTLFGLSIAYSFETWFAASLLTGFLAWRNS